MNLNSLTNNELIAILYNVQDQICKLAIWIENGWKGLDDELAMYLAEELVIWQELEKRRARLN